MNSNTKLTDEDLYEDDSTSPKKKLKNLVVFYCGVKNCQKQFQKKTQQIVVKREFLPHMNEFHQDEWGKSNEQQLEKKYLKKKVISLVQYYCLRCKNDKKFDYLDKPKISLMAHIQQEHKQEYELNKDKWQQLFVGEIQNPNYNTTTGGRPPIRKLTNNTKDENSELDEDDKQFLEDNKVDYRFNGRIDTNQIKVYQDIMEDFNLRKNEMYSEGSKIKDKVQINFDYQHFFGDYFKNPNQLQKLIDMVNLIQSKKVFESEKIAYALYIAHISLISIAQELQPNKNEIQKQLTNEQQTWLNQNPFMKSKLKQVINDIIDAHPYQNFDFNECNGQNEMSYQSGSNGNQLSQDQIYQNNQEHIIKDDTNSPNNYNNQYPENFENNSNNNQQYQFSSDPQQIYQQSKLFRNNRNQSQLNQLPQQQQNNYTMHNQINNNCNKVNFPFNSQQINPQQIQQKNSINQEDEEEDIFQSYNFHSNNQKIQQQYFENRSNIENQRNSNNSSNNNLNNHNNGYYLNNENQNNYYSYSSQQQQQQQQQQQLQQQQPQTQNLQIQQQQQSQTQAQQYSPPQNHYNSQQSSQQQQQQHLNSKKSLEESSIEELQEQLEIIKRKSKQLDS